MNDCQKNTNLLVPTKEISTKALGLIVQVSSFMNTTSQNIGQPYYYVHDN